MAFSDLTEAERLLWAAFPRGSWVDLRAGEESADDLGNAQCWGPGRMIRAEVIRALLLGAGETEPGHTPGVRLRGAHISGQLDLMGATVSAPLICEYCCFDGRVRLVEAVTKTVRIVHSRVPSCNCARLRLDGILNFFGCVIAGTLRLDQAKVTGQVSLAEAEIGAGAGTEAVAAHGLSVDGGVEWPRMTAHGSVSLRVARITGALDLGGARISCPGGPGFAANYAHIGGQFVARNLVVDGLTSLHNTHVAGSMMLSGARLANPPGAALLADGLTVEGGVSLTDGFTTLGEIRMASARLARLDMAGARLDAGDGKVALAVDGAVIEGTVIFTDVTARGEVNLRNAHIGRSVLLTRTHLSNTGEVACRFSGANVAGDVICNGLAVDGRLRMTGSRIGGRLTLDQVRLAGADGIAISARGVQAGELVLRPAEPVRGAVDLSHARIDVLADDPACWPAELSLDGLTYQALEPRIPARQRLSWVARDPRGYQSQPYEHLAAHYESIGQPGQARLVLHERERRQRRAASPLNRAWGILQDIAVGYGYRPWRAVAWLVLLLAAGTVVFAHHPPSALPGPQGAPHFNPFVYTLDLLLPVVDLGQKHAFDPAGAQQWLSYLLVAAGWVLVTTVAAGAARVLTRR